MRILQLCKKFPWPLKDGEAIACTYLARAFHSLGHEVTLLSMNTSKHWFDLENLPADFLHYETVHTVYVDNHIRPLEAFVNLFGRESYHVSRFDNAAYAEKLAELLQQNDFDVVQLESVYLTPYIPVIRRYSKALVALRAHNVEHEIWERVAENASLPKRWYLHRITPRLKRYEIEHINDYDIFVGISERDLIQFRELGMKIPGVVSPIGLDYSDYTPDESSFEQPLALSFIGSLDWMPNQDGLRWFLEEVWTPLLAPNFPELTFHIAGRTAPRWLRELNIERVVFHGEVPDSADFLNSYPVTITPLLSGGGMRAKILEGMALGRVVIATSLGLEGIPARNGVECFVADQPQEWLDAIRGCYKHSEHIRKIGAQARQFCQKNFDNREIAGRLLEQYEKLYKKRRSAIGVHS